MALLASTNEVFFVGLVVGFLIGAAIVGLPMFFSNVNLGKGKRVAAKLHRHLGKSPYDLPVVTKVASLTDLPGLHAAIRELGTVEGQSFIGFGFTGHLAALARLSQAINTSRWDGIYTVPMTYDTFDIGGNESLRFPKNALYLLHSEGVPIAVQVLPGDPSSVAVMAPEAEFAEAFHRRLTEQHRRCSVFRGRILSLESAHEDGYRAGWAKVKLHQFPQVTKDEVILPALTCDLIERNTIRFFQHAEALKRSGYSVKRGILFHGPPGTGKTHALRWLRTSLPNVTVMLITGEQLLNVKECIRFAKWLAPALVLIEDVDLIAQSRDHAINNPLLHQLMNEMDGLSPEEEVIFILTTNRPDDLETAIADRPGRIDQAVQFNLPDANDRQRLIELYSKQVTLAVQDFPALLSKTDGATPAFLRELVRKAALVALDAGSSEPICLSDVHFQTALRELTSGDGGLSRRLLGFKS